ncbi:response regulator [Cerasicoccus frondis]|uniref:response regulator n=1 Tax=Cerasicoccus frondis TaxID=490090 RepID=UPI0028527E59|nr:response regulator [Cerasicoccus frondis]
MNILLVEDNPTDILLAREALKKIEIDHSLHVVEDGEAALKYLSQEDGFNGCPRPDCILLDLNLPRKNGREVLAEIKSVELLKTIPVIVFSTSDAPDDIESAYKLHANCYLVKPSNFDRCVAAFNTLLNFWWNLVELPDHE